MGLGELLRRYRVILFVYLAFIFTYLVSLYWESGIFTWLDSKVASGFAVSLYASFLEDLIFFGVIGLLTILATTKKPEDEVISYRIRSVTNGRHVSENARDYFEEKTREVLAYNSNLVVKIKIKEKVDNNLKLHVEFDNTIRNMCKDVEFTEVRSKAVVCPPACVNGSWGNVSHLTIVDKKNLSAKIVLIEGDTVELEESGYDKDMEFKISEDSEAYYKFCYTIWSEISKDHEKDDSWFYTVVSRYTDDFTISIENQLKQTDVPIIVKYRNRKVNTSDVDVENKCTIRKNETLCLANKVCLHPEDRFRIFFELHPDNIVEAS